VPYQSWLKEFLAKPLTAEQKLQRLGGACAVPGLNSETWDIRLQAESY
jgi:hypothetical protein